MDDLGSREMVNTRAGADVNYVVDKNTNRYTQIAAVPLSYDAAGNLIQDKDGYKYEYDYENRLVKAAGSQDNTIAKYNYDSLGKRIRRQDVTADANTLYYYGDGWQVLAEYDGSDSFKRKYIYGNYIDEVILMNDGSNDYYYLHEHLYSPAVLVNTNGDVVERYEYDAYGRPYIYNDDYSQSYEVSQYGNCYLFTGWRKNKG